jgi:alkylated DNA nucleotide flippase Atl1
MMSGQRECCPTSQGDIIMTSKKPGRAYEHVQRKLTEQERNALRESLAEHGLRDAITLDQHGDILDGYNRFDLCAELGIEPHYRVLEVDDPVHWIRHNQTARRNLGEKEMQELIVETKARNPQASTRTIAEKLGTSQRTVARAIRKATEPDGSINRVVGKDGKVRTYKAKPKPENEKLDAALAEYDRRKLAGEAISRTAIAEAIGSSGMPAQVAIKLRQEQEELVRQEEVVLSASMQEKFDARVRAFKKTFDHEVETKVIGQIKQRLDEWYIPEYMKLLREVKQMLTWKRGVMTRKEYNKVIRCLHPDTGGHASDEARGEAFRLFTIHEARLVDDAEEARLKRVVGLPNTVEEMVARKRTKSARV